MVLYTPLSEQDIYPQSTANHKVISYHGKTVLAQETEDKQLQIVQLISTDPKDYLQQSFTPGIRIKNDYIHDSK